LGGNADEGGAPWEILWPRIEMVLRKDKRNNVSLSLHHMLGAK